MNETNKAIHKMLKENKGDVEYLGGGMFRKKRSTEDDGKEV